MIHSRSSAEKTSRLPLGDGRAPRIWRTVSVVSLTWILEPHQLAEHLVDLGGERDRRLLACGRVDAPDLAVVRDHERLRVGRPGVAGQQVARAARLDVVALDVVRRATSRRLTRARGA